MEKINLTLIIAVLIGLIFPIVSIIYGGQTRKLLTEDPTKKISVYKQTSIQLIVLCLLVLIPSWLGEQNMQAMGLGFIANPLKIASLFMVCVIGIVLLRQVNLTPYQANKARANNARVIFIMPSTLSECRMMILVAFTAGICEEVIYRGFLFWYLSDHMPLVPAILLTNLPFALAHLTSTGFRNSVGAYVLGLIFTGAFLLTGSLWLSILLHILVDLYAAIIGYKTSLHQPKRPNDLESNMLSRI